MKTLPILFLIPTLSWASSTPCEYQHQVTTKFVKEITKVENLKREVFPHADSNRKCVINLDAWLDGVKHSVEGEFSFGPDISENTACGHAEKRAKENLIRRISPEVLSSSTQMNCSSNKTQVAQNQPSVNTSTPSVQNVQPSTQVVPQIIYTQPQIVPVPIQIQPPVFYYPPVYKPAPTVYYLPTSRTPRPPVGGFEPDPAVMSNTGFQFVRNISSTFFSR